MTGSRFHPQVLFKALFIATLVVMGLTGFMPPRAMSTASAIGLPGVTTYYNNAAHSVIVGRESTGCCGEHTFWGQRTIYRTFQRVLCPAIPCPN